MKIGDASVLGWCKMLYIYLAVIIGFYQIFKRVLRLFEIDY